MAAIPQAGDEPAVTLGSWGKRLHLGRHFLVIIVLLGGIYLCTHWISSYVDNTTDEWFSSLTSGLPKELSFTEGSTVNVVEQARMGSLFSAVKARSDMHLAIMKFYYARLISAITTFSLTGALTAILLVLLGKKGWEAANWGTGTGLIFTAFFVVGAATVYFNSWPGVFQLERNISDNKVLALQYLALENEMVTYAATNEALNYSVSIEDLQSQPITTSVVTSTGGISGTLMVLPSNPQQQTLQLGRPMSAKDFIHYIDLRLAKDNIAVGFDFKQVPNYENIFKTQ